MEEILAAADGTERSNDGRSTALTEEIEPRVRRERHRRWRPDEKLKIVQETLRLACPGDCGFGPTTLGRKRPALHLAERDAGDRNASCPAAHTRHDVVGRRGGSGRNRDPSEPAGGA